MRQPSRGFPLELSFDISDCMQSSRLQPSCSYEQKFSTHMSLARSLKAEVVQDQSRAADELRNINEVSGDGARLRPGLRHRRLWQLHEVHSATDVDAWRQNNFNPRPKTVTVTPQTGVERCVTTLSSSTLSESHVVHGVADCRRSPNSREPSSDSGGHGREKNSPIRTTSPYCS